MIAECVMLASWSSHCRVYGCLNVLRGDPPYIPGLSRHLSQCLWSSLIQTFLCEQFLLCHYSDGRIFWGIESDSDNIMKVADREESIKQIYNILFLALFVYYVDNTIRFSLAMTSHHYSEFVIVFYWTAAESRFNKVLSLFLCWRKNELVVFSSGTCSNDRND